MILLWQLIQPFIGYIALGLTALFALLGKGALDRRKGRKEERAAREAADAKATIQAHKERDDVEADVARGGDPRDRLRSNWTR